jgi:hypothetical protein
MLRTSHLNFKTTLMLDNENNALILEKVLLMHYSIDVKLNDVFKSTTISFSKSSTLFKGIYKPLQTHWVNATKITSVYGTATINMSSIKEGLSIMTEKLQFHDVIEQRLKHIRVINTDIITELITMKKVGENKRETDASIKLIAEINAAQLGAIANEYKSYCEKIDISLNSIEKYLSDLNDFTNLLSSNNNPDTLFLIKLNADQADRINQFIGSFRGDRSYRDAFQKSIAEVSNFLSNISSLIKTNEKTSTFHSKLKQLESLYTTQKEREIFNNLVNSGTRKYAKSQNNSGIDLF